MITDADLAGAAGEYSNPIVWIEVANAAAYVHATFHCEAPEIPTALYEGSDWHQTTVLRTSLEVDHAMLAAHANDPVHAGRVFRWCQHLAIGRPILPLIVLDCTRGRRYLADGYARYQACVRLGIQSVSVLQQIRTHSVHDSDQHR